MTDKPGVLLLTPLFYGEREKLDTLFTVYEFKTKITPEIAGKVKALIGDGQAKVDVALMDTFPNLEIIAQYAVGFDGIDLQAAKKRGIRVSNTPGVLTEDVADMALGLFISLKRNLIPNDRLLREGGWLNKEEIPLSHSASNLNVGIFGLGRIGHAIADRLAPMSKSISYCTRHKKDVPWTYYDNVTDLAKAVDVLILAAPGTNETKGLVNKAVFEALGSQGVLINIARGLIVDEPALIEALDKNIIAGAALDVFAHEPNVPKALIQSSKVVLQPHLGSATVETRTAMANLVIENLQAFFAKKPLITPVI
ncbi:2-hydroxyacid dehydrogenase [Zymomonas mobilis]|uniref:D-isomer specific 2-hydroxyacid dehydrogenase NAD-binding protein n=1 Tax=Zymomonas mobilis subsp. pomaceae (strain ATCC 29192 / DSM 22645 / JCM 10191 / CCUG 17912 / NBRC 13757 / NCIMB 11200 / NRRL B-4491 / Barker I) TaxID=579138 RepID=F8ETB7_ZYMMT|nr:2-hydroxyacid dehydrogenase [Zymomonas mobilis]AEI37942.1 D-isomer specific 2-hydroxyacid dehydrogenase NAD-binding protein [Zymomonas mobilis subsp. pomaceae ATCC 29192]MDX5949310.1 2-hydroxyacid dehydrogenase [Zymomonas mobilis subsp. pomaceae]GEB89683.1 dihydrofolate reductase [Zymomonas mobilis subsp. pomaceae]